jgi:hypothetical protein
LKLESKQEQKNSELKKKKKAPPFCVMKPEPYLPPGGRSSSSKAEQWEWARSTRHFPLHFYRERARHNDTLASAISVAVRSPSCRIATQQLRQVLFVFKGATVLVSNVPVKHSRKPRFSQR